MAGKHRKEPVQPERPQKLPKPNPAWVKVSLHDPSIKKLTTEQLKALTK